MLGFRLTPPFTDILVIFQIKMFNNKNNKSHKKKYAMKISSILLPNNFNTFCFELQFFCISGFLFKYEFYLFIRHSELTKK